MRIPAVRWLVAFLTVVFGAFLVTPGCRIQLCKGENCGGDPNVGGWGGSGGGDGAQSSGGTVGQGGGGSSGGSTVDAAATLAQLDSTELLVGRARAGYAAYMLSGLVGEKIAAVPDPSTIDHATVQQFIDEADPIAWAAADDWIATIDLQSLPGITPNDECKKPPNNCKEQYQKCSFAYVCIVVDCGESKCGSCPDLWPLPELAFDHWCVYTCVVDDPPVISGWAIGFHVTLLDEWWYYCHGNH